MANHESDQTAPIDTPRPESVERLLPIVTAMEGLRTATSGGGVSYDIRKVLGYIDTLFGRFAPFKPGDVVEVVTDRYDDVNAAPGWWGAVRKGRRGTVHRIDCDQGKFNAMVELHNQTWTDHHGQEHPVERPGLYCLWESDVTKVQP